MAHVYEHKFVSLQFANTDSRMLRFRNNYPQVVVVVARLQFPGHILNPAKALDDKLLSPQAQQLAHLLN